MTPSVGTDTLAEKMRWVDEKIRQVQRLEPGDSALRQAQQHLYAAQLAGGCGRWKPGHGSPRKSLRRDLYRHLLRAERSLDEIKGRQVRLERSGLRGGIWLRSPDLTLLVDASRGQLLELSDKAAECNLLDAPRGGWVDHLLGVEATVKSFQKGKAPDLERPRKARLWRARVSPNLQMTLTRRTHVGAGPDAATVEQKKSVTLPSRGRKLSFTHQIRNTSKGPLSLLYACELNLNLKDVHVNRLGEVSGLRRFSVLDPALRLEVSWDFSEPARIWYFPLETETPPRERVYQGVRLTFVWPVRLVSGRTWSLRWRMAIQGADGRA